jgi:lathosterol oxidase
MVIDELLEYYTRTFIFGISLGNLVYYGLVAGCLWLFFSVLFRGKFLHRKISSRDPKPRQWKRELYQSLRSIAVFTLVNAAIVCAARSGWTRLYRNIDDYGWVWFFLSMGMMIVVHDTYFYWLHRLLHHPRLYRAIHQTHHLATNPTPWGAYSFGIVEAFLQVAVAPLIVVTIPVHPVAYGLVMLFQIQFSVSGHCGYEIYPQWLLRWRITSVVNAVTHHAMHHEKFHSCFGLYFNVWDRLMGTNHPDYDLWVERLTRDRSEELVQPLAPAVEEASNRKAA